MKTQNSITEVTGKLFKEHFEKRERQIGQQAGVSALLSELRTKDADTRWIHAFERWRKLNEKQRLKYLPRAGVL